MTHPMKQKLAFLPIFFTAFLVLLVSVAKAASVSYEFTQSPSPMPQDVRKISINYQLPEPGLSPENPLWTAKVLIDKVDSSMTWDNLQRAEEFLDDADTRLVAGEEIVAKGKVEEGFLVLQKGEQYLASSYESLSREENSPDKVQFLRKISLAALKHREILENVMLSAPDDGRAVISKVLDTSKLVYDRASLDLNSLGLEAPQNPF